MEAGQVQKTGRLDALAARLDARYRQEVKARELAEKIKQTPPLDANATWREITMWKALEASMSEASGTVQITEEDLETFFWLVERRKERERAKMYAGGEINFKPVLLYLLAAGMLALAVDISFLDALIGLPLLIIGGVLGTFLAMLLFGEAGLILIAIFVLVGLFS